MPVQWRWILFLVLSIQKEKQPQMDILKWEHTGTQTIWTTADLKMIKPCPISWQVQHFFSSLCIDIVWNVFSHQHAGYCLTSENRSEVTHTSGTVVRVATGSIGSLPFKSVIHQLKVYLGIQFLLILLQVNIWCFLKSLSVLKSKSWRFSLLEKYQC